jgi:hypothetical protein
MNRITTFAKTQLMDRFAWLGLPWIILACSFVINVVIGLLIDEPVYSGGIASIHIYMLVLGVTCVTQTFPFAIGFSVRRADYFLGTAASIGIVSLANAVMLWLLGIVELATDGWAIGVHFFHLPYMNAGTAIEQIWFQFAVMVCCFYVGCLSSSIHRRFGKTGLFGFFIALSAAGTVASYLIGYYDKWGAVFETLAGLAATEYANWVFATMLLLALASYLLLRRSTR